MQPIDRTLGRVFGHALYFVVVGPAVMAIVIALPLGEQVRDDWPQVFAVPARFEIRRTPGLPGTDGVQLLILGLSHRLGIGVNRIWRFRQHWRLRQWLKNRSRLGLIKNLMELLIYSESRRRRCGGILLL